MAGTERDGPTDDDAGEREDLGVESDSIDNLDHDDVDGAGAGERSEAAVDVDVDEDVQEDGDDGAGVLNRVREALGDDDEVSGPTRAELVDGARVLFVDPAAKQKSLYDYDLVLITAPAYPEPAILKNDIPIEIPEGSALCAAESATMIDYGGKRVIARANILVPPERVDEISKEHRHDVPEALLGKTVPQRPVQDEDFYNLVLNAAVASSE